MPRDKDVYAKTRLSGLPIDMALNTEIANPKLGYDPNEIITVKYIASNL
jgi:hypothetical protein